MIGGDSRLGAALMAVVVVVSMVTAPVGGATVSGGTVPSGDISNAPDVVLNNATIDPSTSSSVEIGYNVTGTDTANVSVALFNNDTDTLLDSQSGLSTQVGTLNLTIPAGVSSGFLANATLIDGSTGNEIVDTATITVEDNTAPMVGNYSVSNPAGQDIEVGFVTSEQLSVINVSITGTESATLSRTTFNESTTNSGYLYRTVYPGSTDGDYTATLLAAVDAAGNDGASGENQTVSVSSGDSTPPDTLAIDATNPRNQDVGIFVESSEPLAELNVSISGAESAKLRRP